MVPEAKSRHLRIKWVKSDIGYAESQKRTIRALGLRRLGDVVVKPDSASVRGMVNAVSHLVEVEEVLDERA
ncbi:MAG: 50S ribosomal protein L30 [Anaerolineae bacterium]|nr:50S ribosomal protein L30 [Anaerolineae bacterium]